jgi:hypothetical protein
LGFDIGHHRSGLIVRLSAAATAAAAAADLKPVVTAGRLHSSHESSERLNQCAYVQGACFQYDLQMKN